MTQLKINKIIGGLVSLKSLFDKDEKAYAPIYEQFIVELCIENINIGTNKGFLRPFY